MPHRRWKIIACLFLVLATLTVYGDLRNHHFINFDDDVYVTDNPPVQGGLSLTGSVWAFTTLHAGLWIPLTWLSYMVDGQLFGLHPGGYLLTNLLFHIANTLLLFFWLLRTTGALGPSFLVAALFALHPLHVESVAWATERKDVLSTLFWLLTMWAYIWYVESPGFRRYLLILVCFSLGLMAKPMLVTLPFALLLLDYWPLGRWPQKSPGSAKEQSPVSAKKKSPVSAKKKSLASAKKKSLASAKNSRAQKPEPGVPLKRLIWEKAPLLALVVIFSVVTIHAQKEVGAIVQLAYIPFPSRLANALVAYVTYMVRTIYPSGLAVFYPYSRDALPLWQVLGASLTLSFVSLLTIRQTSRHPYLLVGWLWYLGTLVPVIGLVQAGEQALADRFTYVPHIGLFIMVAYGMADLAARWRTPRFLLPVGAGMVLTALMICTWLQVGHWRNSASLFAHTLQVTRNNYLAHNSLGIALLAQGEVDQAITQCEEALRLRPNYAKAHYNLGNALFSRGEVNQALAHYEEALQLQPNYDKAQNSLGFALLSQGRVDQAVAHFEKSLSIRPDSPAVQNNLGLALLSQGKVDQAVAHFEKSLNIQPNSPEVHNNLALALLSQDKVDQAMVHYQEAIRLNPNYPEALDGLARLLATARNQKIRDGATAVQMAERANQLTGYGQPEMLATLAAVYAEAGRFPEAIQASQKALDLAYSANMIELAKDIESRMRLYQAGRPCSGELTPTHPR
jgi:tetratricopeptide (TPR) repeat protein